MWGNWKIQTSLQGGLDYANSEVCRQRQSNLGFRHGPMPEFGIKVLRLGISCLYSEHSVKSSWVEDEVRAALEKEEKFKREQQRKTVLFPIKIDNAIEQEQSQWVAMMRRKRHIGDFTRWKEHDEYQKAFSRLLRDLKASSSDTGK